MDIYVYKTEPEKLQSVLERLLAKGLSNGQWRVVDNKTLESSSGCTSRVRVELTEEGDSKTGA